MIEKIKAYLLNVVLTKMAPAAASFAVTAFAGFWAAHQGMLEPWGITFGTWPLTWGAGQDPSGHVLLIELDTLSEKSVTAVFALAGALYAAGQHHLSNVVTPPSAPPAPNEK